MEDTPGTGIFTYRLKGFNEVPTDHYMRPFYLEAEPDYGRHKKYCIGSLPRHKVRKVFKYLMFKLWVTYLFKLLHLCAYKMFLFSVTTCLNGYQLPY